jgi:hypothetical protein
MQIRALRIGFDYIIVKYDQEMALMRILVSYFQNMSFFLLLSTQLPDYLVAFFDIFKVIGQPLLVISDSLQ